MGAGARDGPRGLDAPPRQVAAPIDALRATMLRGAGLQDLLPELAAIVAWLVTTFLLAVRLFRWR